MFHTGEGFCLGHHKTFKLRWLRKTYNKLGSYLHVPSLVQKNKNQSNENKEIRAYLENVVNTLDPIVESSMDASIAQVVTYKCKKCGELIIANLEGVKRNNHLECLNHNCRAEYSIIQNKEGNPYLIFVTTNFKCTECDSIIKIENRNLKIGLIFICEKCGKCYEIITQKWIYQVKDQK